MLAAGSTFAASFLACNSGGFEIPCLGRATPPSSVPGMTYLWASKIGCALDCDLRTGRNKYTGGAATDDAPRINAAMARASSENPITLIIDGSALISGLFLPAGGYWSIAGLGCGTGFFLKTGTNNDGIHNGPPSAGVPQEPGPPAPVRGMNISLRNFTVNGNQGSGFDGSSTSGTRQGNKYRWLFGINLMNLENIELRNVVVVNTPAYHVRFNNVGNVSVSGCVFKSYGLSTDGLHFDGPSNDIRISGCHFETGDDSIALNCPEGYSGNISGVTVTDCTFNSLSLMRLYTSFGGAARFSIENVKISNCRGNMWQGAFLIGIGAGSNPDSVASLTVSNCVIQAPTVLALAENFGSITLKELTFVPSPSETTWVAPQANHICAFVRPSTLYGGATCVGSTLSFENCQVARFGNIDTPVLLLANDSHIENLVFNGFGVKNAGGSPTPMPSLLNIETGSVKEVVFQALDSSGITTPMAASEFSDIGLVSGAGVLATGWAFPDDVMADGVPYVSMNTGQPAIKQAGMVHPYPG